MPGKPIRVLLVEDSSDDAELVQLELVHGGFLPAVLRVETAEHMRKALDTQEWDVVLSDFHLPAFGAAAALDVLQASGHDLPFIILSGMVRAEEAVKLMRHGAHDFLDKGALARLVPAMEREIRDAAERRSRRAAEEQVRILSMAVEQSPVAVMISDIKGVVAYVNPCFCETSGYGRDEVIGHVPRDVTLGAGLGVDNEFAAVWDSIRSGQVWRGMFQNHRKDGGVYWDEASISPVRDPRGTITHFVSIAQDVTERQMHEEELRHAVEHLTKANTELQRFAYVASHDLQEPLRTLTSFTQLLRRRHGEAMDSEAAEYMGFIVAAAKRMHDLINDLLTYSRISAEERAFGRASLAEACRAALGNLVSSIEEAGAQISVGPLPEVQGDEVQLMQLFQNLISNAIKFRRPGQTPIISVTAEAEDGSVRVRVRDNGIGIASTTQDIFEIFRRLHNQADYPGTGVGLAICKCIVERHQGRIWVESTPGQGSTFFFTLPQAA